MGRLVEPGVERGRPSACPTAKPAAARPTAFSTVLRLARAAMTCRPRPWDGQRVAPVVPPAGAAGAEVVPGRHRRSRAGLLFMAGALTFGICPGRVYQRSLVSHIFRTTPATIGSQRGPVATAS